MLVLLALLQATLMPSLAITHIQPDLVLAAIVAWALLRGPAEGALAGLVAGITMDLLSGAPFGMHAFVMVLVAVTAGFSVALVPNEHAMLLPSVAVFCTIMQQGAYVLLLRSAGWPIDWSQIVLPVVVPLSLLNLLLTVLLYQILSRCSHQMLPEEPGW